ncbi:MAG TPA: hypothetical protein ACFYD4_07610 [Candidatus Wunengus sp. YC61]|uniref:hypothetical protein n=1 Tax=Candidatus Wunengus sp. YC61 TaxID=3367698 RepID=UPI004027A2DA
MDDLTKYGRPRCEGRRLNGLRCQEPKDTPSQYCHYCDALVQKLTTPWHPGYDPKRGRIDGYDFANECKPWFLKKQKEA